MKKVVVVAGQSGCEIVQEFQKRGIEVLLVCGREGESGSAIADHLLVKDLSAYEEIASKILEYSSFVFFGTGHNLAIQLAKSCLKQGGVINFDPKAADLFKNKLDTHKYVQARGFKSPLMYIISDARDEFVPESYPIVLKTERDTFKTQAINNAQEFEDVKSKMLESGSQVLVERYIDGYEVTIPVKASKGAVEAVANSLDMTGINEKAVMILKGFDLKREEKKFNSKYNNVSASVKARIVEATEDIIGSANFIGYPRFDIMVDGEDFYILEVNAIMVAALGGTHYPWHEVGINPASDMVELYLDLTAAM